MKMNDFFAQAYQNSQKSGETSKKDDGVQVSSSIKKAVFLKIDTSKKSESETPKVQKVQAPKVRSQYTSAENKKAYSNQQLDNAIELLKTGGLVKVPVEETKPDGKDSVYRRVAKFLLLIGEEEAAKILPHLSENQIERIIPEIASIRTVDKDEATVIMAEFSELLEKSRQSGGVETAREILEKAYGKKRADQMIKKAMPLEGKRPFEYFDNADNERIYQLINDENVGVQSLVLSNLEPKKAAAIINLMKPEEKKEVVLRLAKMEPVSPDVLRRIDEAMHEKSLNQTTERAEHIDGRNALAQILKKMDVGAENDILGYLSEDDPDLGQDLRSRLFTMEDVVKSDDRFIQEKLQMMEERDIAYLIAAKPDDFREKILSNVSAGRRTEILDQEDILKPMRRSDCERITSEFFSKLRRAYEEGHLIIKDRNDDIVI